MKTILKNETFAELKVNKEVSAIFYYHADHLGSNEIISDNSGAPHEFHLTLPFGETMVEQRKPEANYYNSWKFTGKELDEETGLYYFGVRYYQPSWSVWLSVDPLLEKYQSWNPYNYTMNNPIIYIDPDGKDIVVPNKADRASVLKMINSKALGLYAFDKSGKLYQIKSSGDDSRYSKYYANRLNAAIEADQTIEIRIGEKRGKPTAISNGEGGIKIQHNEGTEEDIDFFGGGITNTVPGGKGENVLVQISGNDNNGTLLDNNGNLLEVEPADILVHELVGHAIPYVAGTDTGNAVENENKVRQQVKKEGQTGPSPLRQAESSHKE